MALKSGNSKDKIRNNLTFWLFVIIIIIKLPYLAWKAHESLGNVQEYPILHQYVPTCDHSTSTVKLMITRP